MSAASVDVRCAESPADEYRRRARRLRGRYRDDPAMLYTGLRRLARQHDAVAAPAKLTPPAIHSASPVRRFAAEVADAVRDPMLPYPRRLELLHTARKLGIGRFEANLVIATFQHQARGSATPAESPSVPADDDEGPWLSARVVTAVAVFVAAQSLIAAAAWWMLHA